MVLIFSAGLYCTPAYSQLSLDSIFSGTPYIFEGTVVKGDSAYYGGRDNWILTAHKVKITKIIRGDLTCGYAKVITFGGTIGSSNGMFAPGMLQITAGEQGIFMCTTQGWPGSHGTTENPVSFSVAGDAQGFFQYGQDYSQNPNPADDSAVVYWDGHHDQFFTSPGAMLDELQQKLGHGYISCTGSENDLPAIFSYYPNPSSGLVTLTIPGVNPATIWLYDMTGKNTLKLDPSAGFSRVLKFNGYAPQTIEQLDITSLSPGAYMGKVIADNKVYSFKLVKL